LTSAYYKISLQIFGQNVTIRLIKAQVLIKMKCCQLKFMTKKLAAECLGFSFVCGRAFFRTRFSQLQDKSGENPIASSAKFD